ncbi:hypothetical protein EV385_4202 [Krasilnikovia cinnamomea]|uniref:DUF3558 domain-containing protein n=1 Tax=Krasilnikovia cinnamomea TaxID=349313 RepID=A0A4Q7ZNS8_9ACTN|nr:hypothetical protein EV385_4202 [Krasilnikovia cinnamomea]
MLRVKKILVAAAAALAMLTVTGCDDATTDTATAGGDNAPCDLVEAAEVAAILGETPEPQRNGANPGGQLCLWDRADDKQSLWLQQLAPRSNPEQHLNGYGWTAEGFTRWADSDAEPVDGLGDKAIYEAKDQLGGGGKAFALSVLHHGERVFVLELHVKGSDGSEADATLDKLRPVAAKIVERH